MGRADPAPIIGPHLFGGQVAKSRSAHRKLAAFDFTPGGSVCGGGDGRDASRTLAKTTGDSSPIARPEPADEVALGRGLVTRHELALTIRRGLSQAFPHR